MLPGATRNERARIERVSELVAADPRWPREDLVLLRELDTAGRRRGAAVCEVAEALGFIRELSEQG